jgi:TRAP-type C4-dicarboxylate transport system permease small subunit
MAAEPAVPPWKRLWHALIWVENATLIGLLGLMVLLAGAQIVSRNLLDLSLIGTDPLLRLLVLWVALLGAVAASREGRHIRVDIVARWLPPRARSAAYALTDLFTVAVCGVLAWQAVRFVLVERASGALAFGQLPGWIAELILPVAFVLIGVRYVIRLVHHLRQCFGREPPVHETPT